MIVGAKLVRGTTYTISFGIDCFLPPCGLHSFFFLFFFIQSPYYGGRGRKISNFFFRFEPENVLKAVWYSIKKSEKIINRLARRGERLTPRPSCSVLKSNFTFVLPLKILLKK